MAQYLQPGEPRQRVQRTSSILCIDDDPAVLECIALVLQSRGYFVQIAENLSQARHVSCAEKHIDLAVIDESVCRREGVCVFSELRAMQPSLVAIVHTGNPDAHTGCIDARSVVLKPSEPNELVRRIEEAMQAGKEENLKAVHDATLRHPPETRA